MTIQPDPVLREHHLKSALRHVQQSVLYTEGMAADGDDHDVDQMYADRATLRHIADELRDIIDNIPTAQEPF